MNLKHHKTLCGSPHGFNSGFMGMLRPSLTRALAQRASSRYGRAKVDLIEQKSKGKTLMFFSSSTHTMVLFDWTKIKLPFSCHGSPGYCCSFWYGIDGCYSILFCESLQQ